MYKPNQDQICWDFPGKIITIAYIVCPVLCLISTRLAEEKAALLKQCEESVSVMAEENEQLKLQLEEVQQELLLTKNQVCVPAQHMKIILSFFLVLFSHPSAS